MDGNFHCGYSKIGHELYGMRDGDAVGTHNPSPESATTLIWRRILNTHHMALANTHRAEGAGNTVFSGNGSCKTRVDYIGIPKTMLGHILK
eukprot:5271256-Pyramimonas_sp.AAC.1